MKAAGFAEILGLFLAVMGAGTVVAAASMVSLTLAVLVAGTFLLFAGVLVVYAAAAADRKPPTPAMSATPPRSGRDG